MKTTHGSFRRPAGAPIHHHRGSCQGNIRRKYSFSSFFLLFTWTVASEILEDNQDISYFTYSLRFFFSSSADMKYYWTIFCLLFSPPTSMDGQRIFFPVCTERLRNIMIFLLSQNFFSPPMSLDGQRKRKYFHRVCTECVGNIMKIYFVTEYFFSSYISGWTEEEKKFNRFCTECNMGI